jgi:hypothetical protein
MVIRTALLTELALNSHGKLKFCQPVTALNSLLWCESILHNPTVIAICTVVLPTVMTLGTFLFKLFTTNHRHVTSLRVKLFTLLLLTTLKTLALRYHNREGSKL